MLRYVALVVALSALMAAAPVGTSVDVDQYIKAPATLIRVDYAVAVIELKPEWTGQFPYAAFLGLQEHFVEVKPGQAQIFVAEKPDEYILPPSVWAYDGKVFCMAGLDGDVGIRGEPGDWKRTVDCTRFFYVKTADGTNLMPWASAADLTRVGSGYLLQLPTPAAEAAILRVGFAAHTKLPIPWEWDLNKMTRLDANHMSKVSEIKVFRSVTGTANILPEMSWTAAEVYRRPTGGGIAMMLTRAQLPYDRQTSIITNAHVVDALLDNEVRVKYGESTALQGLWGVVNAVAYIQLNPRSDWIPVELNRISTDNDLALLSTIWPLGKAPEYQFAPPSCAPVQNDHVWIAGHPLGIADTWVSEGTLRLDQHTVAPGVETWGRARIMTDAPALGGNSGSYIWKQCDGIPMVAGMVHAVYGTPVSTAPAGLEGWEVSKDPVTFGFGEVSMPSPSAITPVAVAPGQLTLGVTLHDIAEMLFSAGVTDMPESLEQWFSYN